jgi:hypothetical protein
MRLSQRIAVLEQCDEIPRSIPGGGITKDRKDLRLYRLSRGIVDSCQSTDPRLKNPEVPFLARFSAIL